jgi:hypothetical protein
VRQCIDVNFLIPVRDEEIVEALEFRFLLQLSVRRAALDIAANPVSGFAAER